MCEETQTMLHRGLPSKIYWYAFAKPIRPYSIAKAIYKVEGRPETSKIYPNIKRMKNKKLLTETGPEVQSNPECLVPEIEKELHSKGIHLTKDNKLRLLRVFQSRFFKDTLKAYIEKEPKIVATRSLDAVREISALLAVACIPTYIMERSTLKAVKPLVEGTRFLGYEEQPFREPTTQDLIEQFLFYLEPNLVFALIQLLPVDIGQVWDSTEEVQNKVNLEANKP